MSDRPEIFAAVSNAMADISAIAKAKKNQQQGFMYRGIDDAMNALHPVLVKHRLFMTPEVLEHTREERQTKNGGNLIYSILKVRYTLYACDGSSVSAVVIGEGMDSADKSSNKAMAVAMKYAVYQLFCIPTEDMAKDDPDGYIPPNSAPKPVKVTTSQAVPTKTGIDRRKETDYVMAQLGFREDKQFLNAYNGLIQGGLMEPKKIADMTDDEFMTMLGMMLASFGEAAS